VKIIWKAPDDAPPSKGAIEWAVREIAARAHLVIPNDTTIVLDNNFIIGSYPLVQAVAPDGDICWFVDYDRVLDELVERTDAEMRAAGEDPTDPNLERQIYRLVRRQLMHWPEEQVKEVISVIMPIINETIAESEHNHDEDI
jgi:hypothetical protein